MEKEVDAAVRRRPSGLKPTAHHHTTTPAEAATIIGLPVFMSSIAGQPGLAQSLPGGQPVGGSGLRRQTWAATVAHPSGVLLTRPRERPKCLVFSLIRDGPSRASGFGLVPAV